MTVTDPVVEQVIPWSSGTSNGAGFNTVFVTTADIAAGKLIVIGNERGASSDPPGIGSVTLSAGAVSGWTRASCAVRASTHDMTMTATLCTTLIPSGSTITVINAGSTSRRAGVLAVFSQATSKVAETTSNNVVSTAVATSNGSNGSSTVETATASAANTNADMLSVAMFCEAGVTSTFTIGSGYTLLAEAKTSVGSGDRGILLGYKILRTAGTASAICTQSGSAVWAAGIATFPITGDVTPPASTGSVIIGGTKKAIASRSVIIGGVKKTVTSTSVIVGGVKKATS